MSRYFIDESKCSKFINEDKKIDTIKITLKW